MQVHMYVRRNIGWKYVPVNIFFIVKGLSPNGESLPPSKLKPSPVPSFLRTTVRGVPRGTSTNFKSVKKRVMDVNFLKMPIY